MQNNSADEVIRAAGGILWRKDSGATKYAIVHRTRYGSVWTLPKGKLAKGERNRHAAIREVSEETGCLPEQIRVISRAGEIAYYVSGKLKVVEFWNMEYMGEGEFGKTDIEVDQVKWVTVDEAIELLIHPKERELIRKFANSALPASL